MSSFLDKLTAFDLQIKKCKYGRGVFAGKDYRMGDLIEICPLIVVENFQSALNWIGHNGLMERYYFDFDEDHSALALGYGSLYNHSRNPNAHYEVNKRDRELIVLARRKITKGNQIFVSYGYDPVKKFKG